ncbi:MAG: nucleotidyltransferase family protein [Prevotella sp.]|nr:nucleotidyltransferase family protein [Prevotella sp.]
MKSNTEQVFFALLQAGLWEKDAQLLPFGEIDFSAVMSLAEEQSVAGLVAAGIEHIVDGRPAKEDVLPFIGRSMQLEQRNMGINRFIGIIVKKMQGEGIETVLVKGQSVAQCYERPQWRSCGDIDFYLNKENYEKAKAYLTPLAASVEDEYVREKHLGMTIGSWVVELHGSLYSGLSSRVEQELAMVYWDTFMNRNIRRWKNGGTEIPILAMENNVFYVFTHILQHFYKGGVGLRQICDWCRLLWTYRQEIDVMKLEGQLRRAGLMTAWRAFGAVAVEYLGMNADAVPFYSDATKWKKKASRIKNYVLMSGNLGHNRDHSYFEKYPFLIRKYVSFSRRMRDLTRHAQVFPLDSLRFFPRILINGMRSAVRGEG